jgi:hypothetical protein
VNTETQGNTAVAEPQKQASSMMEEPTYNSETQTLTIRFTNGVTHAYPSFTPEQFAEFHAAPSWGKYFVTHIRPRYVGQDTRVRESSPDQKSS